MIRGSCAKANRVLRHKIPQPRGLSFIGTTWSLTNRVLHVTCLQRRRLHREIPQPRGLPLIGTTLSLVAAGSAPKLHVYIDRRHKELGPVFRDKIGPIEAVFLADPEEMRLVFAQEGKHPQHMLPEAWRLYNSVYGCKRGLFFMDGEEWLHYRKIMNRLLLKGDLGVIEEACERVAEELVERIREIGPAVPNLERELYRWSLNVITGVLLGGEVYTKAKAHLEELLQQLAKTVSSVFECSVKLQLIPAGVAAKLRLPVWTRFVRCVDDALNTSSLLVNILLDDYPSSKGILRLMLEEKLHRAEIVRLVADLILAAGDTTAYTMEWLLYLVAKHPQVQQQLKTSPSPTLLKNCVRETLRLYPVAPFITRYLPQASTVSGYAVPKGTLVIMSLYTIGRDRRYFEHPEVFDPDRWLRSASTASMQQASLPFAMGARSCVGRKIAETQLQLALAQIARNFHLRLGQESEDVEMVLKMVAVPKEPVKLIFDSLK